MGPSGTERICPTRNGSHVHEDPWFSGPILGETLKEAQQVGHGKGPATFSYKQQLPVHQLPSLEAWGKLPYKCTQVSTQGSITQSTFH